jgi:outer membrane protein assembly factor BamB
MTVHVNQTRRGTRGCTGAAIAIACTLLAVAGSGALALAATPPAGPSPSADPPRRNTMAPFRRGDVFVAATVMNDPIDDHAGAGRILQYDAELRYKGELWLEGTRHKVGGLTFGPDKTLWAMSQLTPAVVEIGPDGRQRPYRTWSPRMLSSVTFAPDGTLLFGEHMMGTQTGHPSVTTRFRVLEGRDVIGDGHVFRYTRDGRLLREYRTAAHGGMFGFLAVTSTVLADGGRRLIYVSETGNVVKQYDLAGDRQLPDLAKFDKDPAMPMVIVMNPRPNGELLISNGTGFATLDRDSGRLLRTYKLPGMGWAAINSSADGASAFVGNFFSGEVVKVRLSDGEIVARANIGQKESLSGVAQFGG